MFLTMFVLAQIDNDFQAVAVDIRQLEETLQGKLNKWILSGRGGDKGAPLPLVAVSAGCAVFVLLDSVWGILGSDGKLKRMIQSPGEEDISYNYEVQIPEHVSDIS